MSVVCWRLTKRKREKGRKSKQKTDFTLFFWFIFCPGFSQYLFCRWVWIEVDSTKCISHFFSISTNSIYHFCALSIRYSLLFSFEFAIQITTPLSCIVIENSTNSFLGSDVKCNAKTVKCECTLGANRNRWALRIIGDNWPKRETETTKDRQNRIDFMCKHIVFPLEWISSYHSQDTSICNAFKRWNSVSFVFVSCLISCQWFSFLLILRALADDEWIDWVIERVTSLPKLATYEERTTDEPEINRKETRIEFDCEVRTMKLLKFAFSTSVNNKWLSSASLEPVLLSLCLMATTVTTEITSLFLSQSERFFFSFSSAKQLVETSGVWIESRRTCKNKMKNSEML